MDPIDLRVRKPSEAYLPVALLVSLIVIWAVSWPIIKVGVRDVTPVWFAVLRYVIGLAAMLPLVIWVKGIEFPPKKDWALILVSGVLQMGTYAALMAFALRTLPAGRGSVIAYSTPLWVVPLGALWLDEKVVRLAAAGVVTGLAGLFIIAAPSFRLNQIDDAIAYAALIGASLAWAITIVYIRGHKFGSSPLALAPWQMAVAALFLLPFALYLEGVPQEFGNNALLSLAFVGPVSTAFAYWAVVEVGRHFRANVIAVALLSTPCLGTVIANLTLGEAIDAPLIAGLVLVAAGISLTLAAQRR